MPSPSSSSSKRHTWNRIITDHKLTQRYLHHQIGAFHYGEAGVDRAVAELRKDPNFAGTSESFWGDQRLEVGGYKVVVTPVIGADGKPTTRRRIHSFGWYNDVGGSSMRQEVVSIAKLGMTYDHWALFGKTSVTATTPVSLGVDSWDSRIGQYGLDGNSGGPNGHVGSNNTLATAAVNFSLATSGSLNGADFVCGPGCTPTGMQAGAVVYDEKRAAEKARDLPSVGVPAIPDEGRLTVSGTTTLAPGEHFFDSVVVSNTGELTSTGPVTIYTFRLSVEGATNGGWIRGPYYDGSPTYRKPTDMDIRIIPSEGEQPQVQLQGNVGIYASIYAPDSTVWIIDSSPLGWGPVIYGAVTAGYLALQHTNGPSTGINIHYDEALGEQPDGTAEQNLWLWRNE